MTRDSRYLFIFLIMAVTVVTLLFKIGDIPPTYPWSDESEIAADAVATLNNGLRFFYPDQLAGGSLAVWLEAAWMALFGKSLLGLRLLNGLLNLASVVLLYLLVNQLPLTLAHSNIQHFTALTAALLWAVSTWLLGLGRIATPNWSLTPLLTLLAFYWFWRGQHTRRQRYFAASGVVLGLLFYGYLPGYFAFLVPTLFVVLTWGINRLYPSHIAVPYSFSLTLYCLLPMLIVAAPLLIFFTLNPATALQRPLQLADTNQLAAGSMAQGVVDMFSTFGLFPNWLWQGKFEALAFDPLVTVLFVAGLLLALWRWRQPGYLFLLLWWGVMLAPALLSRSASQGFIFEVWRRAIGAQPVAFVFPALAVTALGQWTYHFINRHANRSEVGSIGSTARYLLPLLIVIASAALSYWLYFYRWANSGAMPALFAEGPVRLVEWMKANSANDTLFIFPLRPHVSPTTRPELFTVRYLYNGPARLTYPVMDESTVNRELGNALAASPVQVNLMLHQRIPVDPKGYFEYALATSGAVISREQQPDYEVITYRMFNRGPDFNLDSPMMPLDAIFGQNLRLTGYRLRPNLAAGQNLGVTLRWVKLIAEETDYNASLTLYDAQDYAWVKVDKPLLSAGDYLTSRHWPAGSESAQYFTLPIPPDAPPGLYTLRLVAYNAANGAPLPSTGGQADGSLPLAQVELHPNPVQVNPVTLPIPQRFNVEFPGDLTLVGAGGSIPAVAHPGDRAWISLWWQVNLPLKDMGLALALAAPNNKPIPLFNRPQPLLAGQPTWPAQQLYRANYRVLLPPALTGGDYHLALRLVNLKTMEPLAEQLLFPLKVETRVHHFDAPALANPLQVDFGNVIRLRGFELTTEPLPRPARLKLQWQALSEMNDSYKIFIHLTNTAGQIISQVDAWPQQGAALTTSWLSGEIITDELELTLPADTPAGAYRLVIGWYNPETGRRLKTGQDDYVVLVEQLKIR